MYSPSSIIRESGPTSHARPVHAFERSGNGAALHVVEHMLSESNLAGPDIQLRIADYAGRAHRGVRQDWMPEREARSESNQLHVFESDGPMTVLVGSIPLNQPVVGIFSGY